MSDNTASPTSDTSDEVLTDTDAVHVPMGVTVAAAIGPDQQWVTIACPRDIEPGKKLAGITVIADWGDGPEPHDVLFPSPVETVEGMTITVNPDTGGTSVTVI